MWHGKKKRTAREAGKMGDALLTIQNLSAWYSNEKMILSDFSFALDEHEVAGLIGLNGAGKTTFLKVLSGLLPTFRSEGIFFCGAPVDFRKQDFKRCRYTVFAEDNSFSYFTFCELFKEPSTVHWHLLPFPAHHYQSICPAFLKFMICFIKLCNSRRLTRSMPAGRYRT